MATFDNENSAQCLHYTVKLYFKRCKHFKSDCFMTLQEVLYDFSLYNKPPCNCKTFYRFTYMLFPRINTQYYLLSYMNTTQKPLLSNNFSITKRIPNNGVCNDNFVWFTLCLHFIIIIILSCFLKPNRHPTASPCEFSFYWCQVAIWQNLLIMVRSHIADVVC